MLTEELFNANETISFLSSITGQNPGLIKKNIENYDSDQKKNWSPTKLSSGQIYPKQIVRQDSAVTQKNRVNSVQDGQVVTELVN